MHAPSLGSCRRALGAAVAGLFVSLLVPAVGLSRAPSAAATTAPASLTLTGHGFGHGRGMGQYGALGYALAGWSYGQMLDHYYGGTTAGSVPKSTLMTVDMTAHDGQDTIVAQERGEMTTSPAVPTGCTPGSVCAVRISRAGASAFAVYRATSCAGGPGGWVLAGNVNAASVTAIATSGATGAREDMLQLCGQTATQWLRGNIEAVDTGAAQATVNVVAIDDYVRGVVPREMPASWGTLGNGAGEQALDAQAIAARSYALAENRWPWAKTCDTTACQVYGGRAVQDASGFTDLEGTPTYAPSDNAVAATAGVTRVFTSGPSTGSTARTEFSASTGGYTAGGTFPAVADDGDSTPSNPYHAWTATVPTTAITSAFGAGKGSFVSAAVASRNGLGDLGGRVLSVEVSFSGGNVTVSGDAFAAALGLRSNWFAISEPVVPYHVLTADGNVYGFGGAPIAGSPATEHVTSASRGLGEAPAGGYWVLTADGAVHAYNGAGVFGSVAGWRLNGPPRQIVGTPSGHGYWIVASDGGVFAFGDAGFYGSTGNLRLNAPVVGMAPTADGRGYWLLGSDGGVFSYGDAHFFGSTGNLRLAAPVNAMSATPDSRGYWLAASDGGIFAFGLAPFLGSLPGRHIVETAVGIATTPDGAGYLIATRQGNVYGFGDAVTAGGPAQAGASSPTVGVAFSR